MYFGVILSKIWTTPQKEWRPLTQNEPKHHWDAEFQVKCKEASWEERGLDLGMGESPPLEEIPWKKKNNIIAPISTLVPSYQRFWGTEEV